VCFLELVFDRQRLGERISLQQDGRHAFISGSQYIIKELHETLALANLRQNQPARHGAYVHNCQSHCQTGSVPPPGVADYDSDTVHDAVSGAGGNMGDAVNAWYIAAMAGKPEMAQRFIDRCDVLPCAGDICHGVSSPRQITK
jgi:hypothetical protein